jgi:hypothetical protein
MGGPSRVPNAKFGTREPQFYKAGFSPTSVIPGSVWRQGFDEVVEVLCQEQPRPQEWPTEPARRPRSFAALCPNPAGINTDSGHTSSLSPSGVRYRSLDWARASDAAVETTAAAGHPASEEPPRSS